MARVALQLVHVGFTYASAFRPHTSLVMVDAGEWLEVIRRGIESGRKLGHNY